MAINWDWSEPYASQPEIKRYLVDCVGRFDLARHIKLGRTVLRAIWEEAYGRWCVQTEDEEVFRGQVLISAVGLFYEPAYPAIEGLETFAGPIIHSARWKADVPLDARRMAVIGSAASAVQLVPHVAEVAAQLGVYQRTPNYVWQRPTAFTEDEHRSLRERPGAAEAERRKAYDALEEILTLDDPVTMAQLAAAAAQNLSQVEDVELLARMQPSFPIGAKRSLLPNDWYPTFNRANVALITAPISHINSGAIVTIDGASHATDMIIFATGFRTTRFPRQSMSPDGVA